MTEFSHTYSARTPYHRHGNRGYGYYSTRFASDDTSGGSSNIFNPDAGNIGINTELNPTLGLGGGIGIDLTDGSISIGGFDLGD